MKNILAICTHPPYGSSLAREGLDAILAAGVYEQNLSVLFTDDGVFQLLADQHSDTIQQKNISQALAALPLFGIEELYVETESLGERGLSPDMLTLTNINFIARADIADLIAQQHQVFSF